MMKYKTGEKTDSDLAYNPGKISLGKKIALSALTVAGTYGLLGASNTAYSGEPDLSGRPVARSQSEEMPAWAKGLMSKVDSLEDKVQKQERVVGAVATAYQNDGIIDAKEAANIGQVYASTYGAKQEPKPATVAKDTTYAAKDSKKDIQKQEQPVYGVHRRDPQKNVNNVTYSVKKDTDQKDLGVQRRNHSTKSNINTTPQVTISPEPVTYVAASTTPSREINHLYSGELSRKARNTDRYIKGALRHLDVNKTKGKPDLNKRLNGDGRVDSNINDWDFKWGLSDLSNAEKYAKRELNKDKRSLESALATINNIKETYFSTKEDNLISTADKLAKAGRKSQALSLYNQADRVDNKIGNDLKITSRINDLTQKVRPATATVITPTVKTSVAYTGFSDGEQARKAILEVAGNLGNYSSKQVSQLFKKLDASRSRLKGEEYRYLHDNLARFTHGIKLRSEVLGKRSDFDYVTNNDQSENLDSRTLGALNLSGDIMPYSEGTKNFKNFVFDEAKRSGAFDCQKVKESQDKIQKEECIVRPNKIGVALNNGFSYITPFRDFKRAVIMRDVRAVDKQKEVDKKFRGTLKDPEFLEKLSYLNKLMYTTNTWAESKGIGTIFYGSQDSKVPLVDRSALENAIKYEAEHLEETPIEVSLGLNEIIDSHRGVKENCSEDVWKKYDLMHQEHLALKFIIEAEELGKTSKDDKLKKSFRYMGAMLNTIRSPDFYQTTRFLRKDFRCIDPDSGVKRDYNNMLNLESFNDAVLNAELSLGGVVFPDETVTAKRTHGLNILGGFWKTYGMYNMISNFTGGGNGGSNGSAGKGPSGYESHWWDGAAGQ